MRKPPTPYSAPCFIIRRARSVIPLHTSGSVRIPCATYAAEVIKHSDPPTPSHESLRRPARAHAGVAPPLCAFPPSTRPFPNPRRLRWPMGRSRRPALRCPHPRRLGRRTNRGSTEVTLGPGALSTCSLIFLPKQGFECPPKGPHTTGTLPKGHFCAYPNKSAVTCVGASVQSRIDTLALRVGRRVDMTARR